MNIMHKLEMRDGILQNVIYVYYPAEYEFSLDFDSIKRHVKGVAEKIREYAMKNIANFSNGTILLILNGVIVGSVLSTQLLANKSSESLSGNIQTNVSQYHEIENSAPTNTPIAQLDSSSAEISSMDVLEKSQPYTISNLSVTTNETIIPLTLSSGRTIQIGLEDYVTGVVASEMPAEFSSEALKAQAVAARTFALKKLQYGAPLTATTSDQVYQTESELQQMWGSSFHTYYTKVKNAVYSTKGEYITYQGNLIDALYFSTSNGKTEEPIHVWGFSAPYLKSVDSSFESEVRDFQTHISFSKQELAQKLSLDPNTITDIIINERTIGNRVKSVTIGNKTFDGTKIRDLLGLRSTDFTAKITNDTVTFEVTGYGHGVGMSQYGANILSKRGYTYQDILKYYYQGVEIAKQ